MTRLLFVVGILLAEPVMMTPAPASSAASNASATSGDCFAQLWACYVRTDRPASEPDCYEQFVACLQAAPGSD